MPNHIHLLHPDEDLRPRLAQALGDHARWLNARHGRSGALIEPILEPTDGGTTAQKLYRQIRYVHLNPCRSKLASDPLEWPFSTHRDACGLIDEPVVPVRDDVVRFHSYVSSDPSVAVNGTDLRHIVPHPTPRQVLDAVSAVTRTPLAELRQRGPARELFVGMARQLCPGHKNQEIAALVEISTARVSRIVTPSAPAPRIIRLVAGDPRFGPLDDLRLPFRAHVRG